MKIEIKGKEYPLVYNIRTMMLFEGLRDKAFGITTVTDWLFLVYSSILAANKNLEYTLDEFIEDYMDDVHLEALQPYFDWLRGQMEVSQQFVDKKEEGTKKK